jgi:VanZ family protein
MACLRREIREPPVYPRKIIRVVAWVLLASAIVLTVVPAHFRPVTGAPSPVEHFAMFFLIGSAFTLGYSRSDYPFCGAAIAFAGSLELLQLFVPGRHARLSDFAIDALAAVIGIAVSGLINRNNLLPLGPNGSTGV